MKCSTSDFDLRPIGEATFPPLLGQPWYLYADGRIIQTSLVEAIQPSVAGGRMVLTRNSVYLLRDDRAVFGPSPRVVFDVGVPAGKAEP